MKVTRRRGDAEKDISDFSRVVRAAMLSSAMNGFYGLRRVRGNEPLDMADYTFGNWAVGPVPRLRDRRAVT